MITNALHSTLVMWLLSLEGVALFLLVGLLAILIWGAATVCSQLYMPVICRKKTDKLLMSITFDDGPSEFTPRILEVLEKHQIKATFFLIGKHAERSPEMVRHIHNQGHTIGNHTYSHSPLFDLWPAKRMADDIAKCSRIITDLTNKKTVLFRPPFGVTNPPLAKAVKKNTLTTIGWSLRSLDTVKSADKLQKKLLRKSGPGKIILLHDTMYSTAKILDIFITQAKRLGYTFVPLSEMINIPATKNSQPHEK